MLWGKGNSFPIECEARLPVKACTFMLERQTALFRSLVDEARLFFYRHNSCSCHGCAQPVPETVMGMGDISKVDTWREPDGVRVDKLIMRLSHAKIVMLASTAFLKPDDLACYAALRIDPREMRNGYYPMAIDVTMPLLGDMVTCKSTVLLEDVEEGGCRALLRGTLHIDLPLIGKRVQQEIMHAAVQHHRMLPQIFDRYQQVRAELMKTAVGRSALLSGVPEMGLDTDELFRNLQQAYTDGIEGGEPSRAEQISAGGEQAQQAEEHAEAAKGPGPAGPASIAFGQQHTMPDITAAMADAQTVSAARTDFAAAAEWNRDMSKWRELWRKLDIARAPIPAPMQKLVAMFLSGEGTSWAQKQMPAGDRGGAEDQAANTATQEVEAAGGPSGGADAAPPPQERAAGTAQAAPHEEPSHANQTEDDKACAGETTTLGQKLLKLLGCYRMRWRATEAGPD